MRHDDRVALATVLSDRRVGAAACVAAGVLPLIYWSVADLSHDATSQQHEWSIVLLFSAMLLGLGLGFLAVAGRLSGSHAIRTARFLAIVFAAASVTNLVEDGLRVEAAFLIFVVELLSIHLGCGVLAFLILTREHRSGRLWAVVPIGTIIGILLFVEAGGPLLAVTWVGAALYALRQPSRA